MSDKVLMKGNEALAEGAVRAGCRFFAGYPITPQNEVPEYMSWRQPEVGGTFVQAESEVAAINMIFGAASTGTRCMTSSSSPGISLKQEGISYAAGADLPFFYANVVRGGPGLGNIAAGQGDYHQSVRGGGHGDYHVIVLAPNSVEEMGNFPRRCYELAEKYRVPAMVLSDGILGQMMEPMAFDFAPVDPKTLKEKTWALGNGTGRGKRIVRSYDLREGKLELLNLERIKRFQAIEANEVLFETRDVEDADLVVVAYGVASRISAGAIKLARERGLKVGFFRPITLWPFPTQALQKLAQQNKNFLVVEMSMGQFVQDVRLAVCGAARVDLYARPAGIPTSEEVLTAIENVYRPVAPARATAKVRRPRKPKARKTGAVAAKKSVKAAATERGHRLTTKAAAVRRGKRQAGKAAVVKRGSNKKAVKPPQRTVKAKARAVKKVAGRGRKGGRK